ncbi:hypothetical protein SAY87_000016 [Trapa incisa]|uniref:Uncharacterized protein n=1 Tax=Trapa incisa TaxID=236973 RepID=A0AAN7JGN1_9MYRT|nr:hypothetical protein SAY87_000016 [Trapa incisa]
MEEKWQGKRSLRRKAVIMRDMRWIRRSGKRNLGLEDELLNLNDQRQEDEIKGWSKYKPIFFLIKVNGAIAVGQYNAKGKLY